MNFFLVYLVCTVVIILFLFKTYRVNNDICILLTTTVSVKKDMRFIAQSDKDERVQTYLKSIRQWLEKTDYKVVVVENSGYMFEELRKEKIQYKDRFEIITFNEETLKGAEYLKEIKNKGDHEVFAIQYAYENSKLLHDSDFIIKITGRYYVPGLQPYLQRTYLKQYHAISQYDSDRCELIGCSNEAFPMMFDLNMEDEKGYNPQAESVYKYRMTKKIESKELLVLPAFVIEPTKRGGVAEIFTVL